MEVFVMLVLAVLSSTAVTALISHLMNKRQYNQTVLQTEADTAVLDAQSKDIITQASERALNMVVTQLELAQVRILHLESELIKAFEKIEHLEARLLEQEMRDSGD